MNLSKNKIITPIKTIADYENLKNIQFVILDCYATWCRPCKQLMKYLESIVDTYNDYDFYKVDIEELEELEDILPDTLPTVQILNYGKLINTFTFSGKKNWNIIAEYMDYDLNK